MLNFVIQIAIEVSQRDFCNSCALLIAGIKLILRVTMFNKPKIA